VIIGLGLMTENITIDYGKSPEFPDHLEIIDNLDLLYDDDTGKTIAPTGEEFLLGIYPKAQYINISSSQDGEELPDIVMELIIHLPTAGATVILDGSDDNLDIAISLEDFREILIKEEE